MKRPQGLKNPPGVGRNEPGGNPVKNDLLLRIKDAETSAKSREDAAHAEAQKIVAEARRQAESVVADAKQQADFAYQGRLDQARASAKAESEKVVAEGHKKATANRKKFETGLNAAVERTVKRIEGHLA